jgi:hypothetical protein
MAGDVDPPNARVLYHVDGVISTGIPRDSGNRKGRGDPFASAAAGKTGAAGLCPVGLVDREVIAFRITGAASPILCVGTAGSCSFP